MSDANTGSGEFRQQVRMAAVQVAGLRPDELAQALAYEVEPLSGIPATEADVTYQPVIDADPTVRVYDVVVRRRVRRKGATGGLERWLRPAIVFAALAVLTIVGDGARIAVHRAALRKTVRARRPLQMELDRLQSEEKSVRAAAEAIRNRREAAVRAQDNAATLRTLHADLLGELATACERDTVIKSIAAVSDSQSAADGVKSLRIQAIDVSGEAAAMTMQTLAAHVSTNGWQLLPGEIVEGGTGATASFSFDLTRTR